MSGAAGTCSGLAAAASARSASSCAGGVGGSRGRQSAAGGSGGSSPPPAAEHTPSCRRGSAASGSESVSQVESQSSTVVGSLKLTPLSRLPMGPEAAEAEGWERPRAAYGCGMAGRGGGGRGCSPARPQPTDTRGAELEPPGSPQEPRAQPWRRHRAHPGGGTAGSGGAALGPPPQRASRAPGDSGSRPSEQVRAIHLAEATALSPKARETSKWVRVFIERGGDGGCPRAMVWGGDVWGQKWPCHLQCASSGCPLSMGTAVVR